MPRTIPSRATGARAQAASAGLAHLRPSPGAPRRSPAAPQAWRLPLHPRGRPPTAHQVGEIAAGRTGGPPAGRPPWGRYGPPGPVTPPSRRGYPCRRSSSVSSILREGLVEPRRRRVTTHYTPIRSSRQADKIASTESVINRAINCASEAGV